MVDKFIFKPKFNNKLDDYCELISNHDTLIFYNYDDCNVCIESNSENYVDNFQHSCFNQQIDLPSSLKYLKLDCINVNIINYLFTKWY